MVMELAEVVWAPHQFKFTASLLLKARGRVRELYHFHMGEPVISIDAFRLLSGGLKYTFMDRTWELSYVDEEEAAIQDLSLEPTADDTTRDHSPETTPRAARFIAHSEEPMLPPQINRLILAPKGHSSPKFVLYFQRCGEGASVALEEVGVNVEEASLSVEFPQGITNFVLGHLNHVLSRLPVMEWRLMTVVHHDICLVDVDAIVNSSPLSMGAYTAVAVNIHRAAGPELQRACEEVAPLTEEVPCKSTPGFNLPARNIIHVHVVNSVYATENNELTVLTNSYILCMNEARRIGVRTVAFPALGAGGGGYSLEVASEAAYRAVLIYPHLRVHFDHLYLVCYPGNPQVDPFLFALRTGQRSMAHILKDRLG